MLLRENLEQNVAVFLTLRRQGRACVGRAVFELAKGTVHRQTICDENDKTKKDCTFIQNIIARKPDFKSFIVLFLNIILLK